METGTLWRAVQGKGGKIKIKKKQTSTRRKKGGRTQVLKDV